MRLDKALCVISFLLLLASDAVAGVRYESAKIVPQDGAAHDGFGYAVAINGSMVVVGSVFSDALGEDSGSAYLYNANTGELVFELVPGDGMPGDLFGVAVAISDSIIVVGASGSDAGGIDSGSAYVFDVNTGAQLHKLFSEDISERDAFGISVGVSGTRVVVGARHDDENGVAAGAAYVFDAISGEELHALWADDGIPFDWLGHSCEIDQSIAIVGTTRRQDNGPNSGAAYLFNSSDGTQRTKLLPADGAESSVFGWSVDVRNHQAIVGSPGSNGAGEASGAAYLFDADTGLEVLKYVPEDSEAGDRFGGSVAMNDDLVIISSIGDDENGEQAGAAYLFDIATGRELVKLLPSDGAEDDLFGVWVAIDGQTVVVGVPRADVSGENSGAIYLFDASVCFTDINGDSITDTADLGVLISRLGADDQVADINGDGVVDTADLGILLDRFGTTCP